MPVHGLCNSSDHETRQLHGDFFVPQGTGCDDYQIAGSLYETKVLGHNTKMSPTPTTLIH